MMWIFLLSDAFTFSSLLVGYGAIRYSFPSTPQEQIEGLGLKFGEDVQAKFADGAAAHGEHAEHAEHFIPALREAGVFTELQWPSPDLVFNHFPFAHGLHLPLIFVSLMTLILILSSVTMVLGVEAGQRMDQKGVAKWLFWTIVGGFAFLSCQAWEWTNFITAGATPWANPYGPPTFAALFFLVTGFHGFHVFSGVVLNVITYLNVRKGTYEERGHYEMVEKVGLYWHFVDLVWVFVFTFFYLI
ncbi:MAG: cytochrome oxidase subunit III [Bacteroidia bacterium]|nr:cytochrome oxidase subunit III [Bacteroidia bacterium]